MGTAPLPVVAPALVTLLSPTIGGWGTHSGHTRTQTLEEQTPTGALIGHYAPVRGDMTMLIAPVLGVEAHALVCAV